MCGCEETGPILNIRARNRLEYAWVFHVECDLLRSSLRVRNEPGWWS